ncbi:hypothetical protein [Bradyrhizobium sp. UFLA05-112]
MAGPGRAFARDLGLWGGLTVVAVPIVMLRLARSQFDILSDGFAKNGDVISRAISEIGGCAIDQALAGKQP